MGSKSNAGNYLAFREAVWRWCEQISQAKMFAVLQ